MMTEANVAHLSFFFIFYCLLHIETQKKCFLVVLSSLYLINHKQNVSIIIKVFFSLLQDELDKFFLEAYHINCDEFSM